MQISEQTAAAATAAVWAPEPNNKQFNGIQRGWAEESSLFRRKKNPNRMTNERVVVREWWFVPSLAPFTGQGGEEGTKEDE